MTQNKQSRSRLSYAREQPELARDNPLNGKAESLTAQFETQRCHLHAKQMADAANDDAKRRRELEIFKAKRRSPSLGSEMVQRHKPHPELKPSPKLSRGVKAQAHSQELGREQQQARHSEKITEGQAIVGELLDYLKYLDLEARNAMEITRPAQGKTLANVEREAFKLLRRVHERGDNVIAKSQSFRQSINN